MTQRTDQPDRLELLSAFTDGEIDAAQTSAVLDYLAQTPAAHSYLLDRQVLQDAARRIAQVDENANKAPQALKSRLAELALSATEERDRSSPVTRFPHRAGAARAWLGRAGLMAACLAVGLSIGAVLMRLHAKAASTGDDLAIIDASQKRESLDARESAIPVSLVDAAMYVHVDCSRVDESLHSAGYPAELGPLSTLVKQDFGSSAPEPDLSAMGYHYVGAGPCAKPLAGTVHLLYRKDGPTPRAAVSVFAQAYRGQFKLSPGRLYWIAGQGNRFPMFAWRTNDVVYFLIADDLSTAEAGVGKVRAEMPAARLAAP